MITTTWQILWMPRCEEGQPTGFGEAAPQPAAAPAASSRRAAVAAALS
jgi:hypothetical protein